MTSSGWGEHSQQRPGWSMKVRTVVGTEAGSSEWVDRTGCTAADTVHTVTVAEAAAGA